MLFESLLFPLGGQESTVEIELLFLITFKAAIRSDIVMVWLVELLEDVLFLSLLVDGDAEEEDMASKMLSKGSSLNDFRNSIKISSLKSFRFLLISKGGEHKSSE